MEIIRNKKTINKRRKELKMFKNSCLGKIKHKYRTSAEYVLEQMPKNSDLEVYECKNCNNYHIGHSTL